MFVNREKELLRLQSALSKDTAQMIAVYGRRRCGKSALLCRVLSGESVYYVADLRETQLQIADLAKQISNSIPGFEKPVYPDWESLFNSFNLALKQKTILCIDEFPYLVKNSPELPSVLQKIRDSHGHDRFHLIICGSSQQMMQSMLLDSSSPLYGRCDEILRINPMGLHDMAMFLDLKASDAIREFSIWGGVPRYWEIRRQSEGFKEAVHWNLLDTNGILFDEPERLFADEMRTSVQAYSVISLIAGGSHRLSEIAGRLGKPATHLSRILSFLVDLGYIRREIPFGELERSSKKSLYKLNDPFLRFYFTWVLPNKSRLRLGQISEIWRNFETNMNTYISEIWEELCREYIAGHEIGGHRFLPASRWWGNGTDGSPLEIDIVAESDDHNFLLIGEVKWSDNPAISEILSQLNQKSIKIPYSKGKSILKVIFIKNKPEKTDENILLFDSDDVVVSR